MQRKFYFTGFLLFLWGTAAAAPSWCDDTAQFILDPPRQWHFAEQLFEQGRYRQAAQEYERFAFFFPDHPDRRLAIFKAGRSYMLSAEGIAALQSFNSLTTDDRLDPVAVDAYFMMAETYLMLDNAGQALLQLSNLIALTEQTETQDRAYLRIGWIHLEQLDWSAALRAWQQISAPGRQAYQVDALTSAVEQADRIPMKTPALAGVLSVLPGAGQLYCGRYEDALAAFVVNGGLFWGAYEAFDKDLNGLGALLAFTGLGFYTANIYGAVSSAHKVNLRRKQGFVDQIKRSMVIRFEPSGPAPGTAQAISLQWTLLF